MPVGNQSDDPVDYDVQPSDPGPPPAPQVRGVRNATASALISSAIGTGFVGFGCLTGFGDQAFVLAGLGFLVVGLVFQGVALERARRLASESVAFRLSGSGRTRLANGDENPQTIPFGKWVEFWSVEDPTLKLAQSPVILTRNATVVLRRCADPSHVTLGAKLAPGDLGYHVDVL